MDTYLVLYGLKSGNGAHVKNKVEWREIQRHTATVLDTRKCKPFFLSFGILLFHPNIKAKLTGECCRIDTVYHYSTVGINEAAL